MRFGLLSHGFPAGEKIALLIGCQGMGKIKQDKAYRTKPPTLKNLQNVMSDLVLLKKNILRKSSKKQITKMIVHKFGGDRRKAELVCLEWLKLNMNENISTEKKNSIPMTELALMCHAMNFPVKHHKDLIQK